MSPTFAHLRPKELTQFNDVLHGILSELGDFVWSPWELRCIEFHFGQGHYALGDSFGWHMHQELQLELVVEGSFRFAVKGEDSFTLRQGGVFVVPPKQLHRWECLEPALMIGISLASLPSAEAEIDMISDRLQPTVETPRALDMQVGSLIRELSIKGKARDIFRNQRLRAWAFLIISQILNHALPKTSERPADQTKASPPSRSRRVVSKIVRFVDANIDGDLSMARFEQAVGMSSRHIHRIFMEVTGMSCHKYVANRRLEVARSLLQNDASLSIKQVAYATGFASPAHFSSSFRKSFGVSPSEYSPESISTKY